MALLEKIPPMISALAFGYGVGMVAPDTTVQNMRYTMGAARPGPQGPWGWGQGWSGYGPGGETAPYGYTFSPYPPPPMSRPRGEGPFLSSGESQQLSRLRGLGEGQSCQLGRMQSSPDEVAIDGEPSAELDDLDPAAKDALSRLQLPDFPVSITRGALRYVRFLTRTERGRDLFESWLKRSGRYQELLQQTLREWHLPEDLIWVAMIESGFDPRARSPAGAMGLWQFMQATGEVYGLEVNAHVDQRMNPVKASHAAAHHLRDLFQRFGAWELAFAAYNMGYEQLLERIDRYGTTDFHELARQQALPRETAAYVPKIVAAALVANNLERYGFDDVKVYRPVTFSELVVPGGAPLSVIAKAAGISTSALRSLNPHFKTTHVPFGGEVTVMVPPDTLSRAHAALPVMVERRGVVTDADILEPDNLGLDAGDGKSSRHHAWNEDENLLRLLPKPKRRSLRNVLRGERQVLEDDPAAGLAEDFAPARADRETVMYRVGSGDTLIGVARQFAIDVDDLARDNNLDPEERLHEGALLKLSVKRGVLERWKQRGGMPAREAPARPRQKGDNAAG
jgi:membrane-bound lytic murein transglycosylase D